MLGQRLWRKDDPYFDSRLGNISVGGESKEIETERKGEREEEIKGRKGGKRRK